MKIVKEEIFGPVGAVIKFGISILSWLSPTRSHLFLIAKTSRRPTTRYIVLPHIFSARISLELSSRYTNSRQDRMGELG